MKNVSNWTFSAPLTKVDLPRIVEEASRVRGSTIGVVRVEVDGEFIVLATVAAVCQAVEAPSPTGYLSNTAHMSRDYALDEEFTGTTAVNELEIAESWEVPLSAVAVFFPRDRNAADELVGKLCDRVVVNVEVF